MEVNYFNTDALADKYAEQFFESDFWKSLVMSSHEKTANKILEHISRQIKIDIIRGKFSQWAISIDMDFRGNGVYVIIPCEMLLRYNGDYSLGKIKDLTIDKDSTASDFKIHNTAEDSESMIMSVRFTWKVFFPFDDKGKTFEKATFSRSVFSDDDIEEYVSAVNDYMESHDIYDILDKELKDELDRHNIEFEHLELCEEEMGGDYVSMLYKCKYTGDLRDIPDIDISTYLPTYKNSHGAVDKDSFVNIGLSGYDDEHAYWEVFLDIDDYY